MRNIRILCVIYTHILLFVNYMQNNTYIIRELYVKYTYVMCDIYTYIIIRELYVKYTYIKCNIYTLLILHYFTLFIVYYIFIHNKDNFISFYKYKKYKYFIFLNNSNNKI